jgi:hypothetical protein
VHASTLEIDFTQSREGANSPARVLNSARDDPGEFTVRVS